jgi:hypothetical protein
MNLINYLTDFLDNGKLSDIFKNEKYLKTIGFAGYIFGAFNLFLCLKVANYIPGKLFSFLLFFLLILLANYTATAFSSLFMSMINNKDNSALLFYSFGIAQFIWLFFLPLLFLSNFSFFSTFTLLVLILFIFKIKLIKELYNTSYKTACLSFIAPYFLISSIFFLSFFYSIYWLSSFI